jgi:hypothetical protein
MELNTCRFIVVRSLRTGKYCGEYIDEYGTYGAYPHFTYDMPIDLGEMFIMPDTRIGFVYQPQNLSTYLTYDGKQIQIDQHKPEEIELVLFEIKKCGTIKPEAL